MSAGSDLIFIPTTADVGNGVWSGVARLTAPTGNVGIPPAPGLAYNSWSFSNRNANQIVRVNFAMANAVVGDTQVVVYPGMTSSGTIDTDEITGFSLDVVNTPAAGAITNASGFTVSGAVIGTLDVSFQLVNQ